ncbi:hypothetical protein BLNAU_16107 [Blattamonas nauphoetae]|uniref:Uncharacterized protein n=1 Tax=Blattamonas nauphoetae TaxID=2049346 RepID=A0ABQ9XFC2_9EUKA|nr:hypothetical protein BLNAU_16107 [Blattamonas nauphoetae]
MTRPLASMPNIVILSNESAQSWSSPDDFGGDEQISPPMETPSYPLNVWGVLVVVSFFPNYCCNVTVLNSDKSPTL